MTELFAHTLFVNVFLASAAAHAPGIETLLFPLINFLIFSSIFVWLYRRYGAPLLRQRRAEIEQMINKWTGQLGQLDRELADVNDQLSSFEAERARMLGEFEVEGDKIAAEIALSTRSAIEALERETKRRISREYGVAEDEIRSEVVRRGAASARKTLFADLSSEQDRRLREEVIERLFR